MKTNFKYWFFLLEAGEVLCPKCGGEMIARVNKKTNGQFYGCRRFPNCKGIRSIGGNEIKPKSLPDQVAQITQQQTAVNIPSPTWFAAKVIMADAQKGIDLNQPIALRKQADGNWEFKTAYKQGTFLSSEVSKFVRSEKDEHGNTMRSESPDELIKKLTPMAPGQRASNTLPDSKMSLEQKKIDARFEHMIEGHGGVNHMIINALAGSGKTTMLRHLAAKFGKPGEKWLYLVFNTKNKIEAQEKFPPFVDIKTTNGFLGELLKNAKNLGSLPQTDRVMQAIKTKEGKKVPDKSRIIADGADFAQVIKKLGIYSFQDVPQEDLDEMQEDMQKTLRNVIRSINYEFREEAIRLASLGKAFAHDPRAGDIKEKLDKLASGYQMDFFFPNIKERTEKYQGNYGQQIRQALNKLFKTDSFTQKKFKEEGVAAAEWLMKQMLPGVSKHKHKQQYGSRVYEMGQLRDFDDDLWYAALYADQLNWPKYKVVLADEVQDFNECQRIMLKKLADAGATVVAVGDPSQAIYRFRGANSKSFSNLKKTLEDSSSEKDNVEHSLTTNFRSRSAIIDYANQATKVKNLKGKVFEDGDPGKVEQGGNYADVFTNLEQEKKTGKIKETAFIARTNAPLIHAALSLLARGIPFVIVGKDIANDLTKHIEKVRRMKDLDDNSDVGYLWEALHNHKKEETETHGNKTSQKHYVQELIETTDALLGCIEQFQDEGSGKSIVEFKEWLRERLGGLNVSESEADLKAYKKKVEENAVILTTAHKSKGLEFSRVYILRNDQFPHKKATSAEDLEQEENARYVSYTRAKDSLHILDPKTQPGLKGEKNNDNNVDQRLY